MGASEPDANAEGREERDAAVFGALDDARAVGGRIEDERRVDLDEVARVEDVQKVGIERPPFTAPPRAAHYYGQWARRLKEPLFARVLLNLSQWNSVTRTKSGSRLLDATQKLRVMRQPIFEPVLFR